MPQGHSSVRAQFQAAATNATMGVKGSVVILSEPTPRSRTATGVNCPITNKINVLFRRTLWQFAQNSWSVIGCRVE